MRKTVFTLLGLALLSLLNSCTDIRKSSKTENGINAVNLDFWSDGKAEVSSYKLTQARYGELHEGNAVLIYVTEPFSTNSWTKADNSSKENREVLKLNFTKKFNTGIYPYSMMNSSFFPLKNGKSSLKISNSSQEWCGHTYTELRNDSKFDFQLNSYFQSDKQGKFSIPKNNLEDDFWSIIRLNPAQLPVGELQVIPSFFYLRLAHKETQAYKAVLSSSKKDETTTSYKIEYPELDRTLIINYETSFPHKILSWEETYVSGWGKKAKKLTSTASLIKSIRTDYWSKHSNKDSQLRTELGLE